MDIGKKISIAMIILFVLFFIIMIFKFIYSDYTFNKNIIKDSPIEYKLDSNLIKKDIIIDSLKMALSNKELESIRRNKDIDRLFEIINILSSNEVDEEYKKEIKEHYNLNNYKN